MGRRFEFEWAIAPSDDGSTGKVMVRERLAGFDGANYYGPMSRGVADTFIKARRMWVHRQVMTQTQAMQVFEPRPQLIGISAAQRRARYDA